MAPAKVSRLPAISPTLCLEYLTCPRHFAYKRLGHLSLVLPAWQGVATRAYQFIQYLTVRLLNVVFYPLEEIPSPPNLMDPPFREAQCQLGQVSPSTFFAALEEQVRTFFAWFFNAFCSSSEYHPSPIQTLVNVYERITAPTIGFMGRPSAIFQYTDDSVLILIQVYRLPSQVNEASLQAALYARILAENDLEVRDFLYVNYRTSDIRYRPVQVEDFALLDQTLDRIEGALVDYDFDPPASPPCVSCEFDSLCNSL